MDVMLVTASPALCDEIGAAAAALGRRVAVCLPEAMDAHWESARAVFVGVDCAAELAAQALPRRDRLYLVGDDAGAAALWSVPLGAEVIGLPEGREWLSSVLAGPAGGGQVMAVLGGSGGVGASTLAAALAWRAAAGRRAVALVDVDRLGGGIDLLLGAEREAGWRWPRFASAEGVLGELGEFLPSADGVAVLSMARGPDPGPGREALAAVLASLRRGFELVVLDPGRSGGPAAREALRAADRTVLLAGGSVRGLAAAVETVRVLAPAAIEVVVRRLPGTVVPDELVEDSLGLPVTARLRNEPALAVAAQRGDRPTLSGRRHGLGRVCDTLLGAR